MILLLFNAFFCADFIDADYKMGTGESVVTLDAIDFPYDDPYDEEDDYDYDYIDLFANNVFGNFATFRESVRHINIFEDDGTAIYPDGLSIPIKIQNLKIIDHDEVQFYDRNNKHTKLYVCKMSCLCDGAHVDLFLTPKQIECFTDSKHVERYDLLNYLLFDDCKDKYADWVEGNSAFNIKIKNQQERIKQILQDAKKLATVKYSPEDSGDDREDVQLTRSEGNSSVIKSNDSGSFTIQSTPESKALIDDLAIKCPSIIRKGEADLSWTKDASLNTPIGSVNAAIEFKKQNDLEESRAVVQVGNRKLYTSANEVSGETAIATISSAIESDSSIAMQAIESVNRVTNAFEKILDDEDGRQSQNIKSLLSRMKQSASAAKQNAQDFIAQVQSEKDSPDCYTDGLLTVASIKIEKDGQYQSESNIDREFLTQRFIQDTEEGLVQGTQSVSGFDYQLFGSRFQGNVGSTSVTKNNLAVVDINLNFTIDGRTAVERLIGDADNLENMKNGIRDITSELRYKFKEIIDTKNDIVEEIAEKTKAINRMEDEIAIIEAEIVDTPEKKTRQQKQKLSLRQKFLETALEVESLQKDLEETSTEEIEMALKVRRAQSILERAEQKASEASQAVSEANSELAKFKKKFFGAVPVGKIVDKKSNDFVPALSSFISEGLNSVSKTYRVGLTGLFTEITGDLISSTAAVTREYEIVKNRGIFYWGKLALEEARNLVGSYLYTLDTSWSLETSNPFSKVFNGITCTIFNLIRYTSSLTCSDIPKISLTQAPFLLKYLFNQWWSTDSQSLYTSLTNVISYLGTAVFAFTRPGLVWLYALWSYTFNKAPKIETYDFDSGYFKNYSNAQIIDNENVFNQPVLFDLSKQSQMLFDLSKRSQINSLGQGLIQQINPLG